jgi:uncharacterized protein (DUF1778 family)
MPTKKKPAKKPRTTKASGPLSARIMIRASKAQARLWEAAAQAEQRSLTQWMRMAADARLKNGPAVDDE